MEATPRSIRDPQGARSYRARVRLGRIRDALLTISTGGNSCTRVQGSRVLLCCYEWDIKCTVRGWERSHRGQQGSDTGPSSEDMCSDSAGLYVLRLDVRGGGQDWGIYVLAVSGPWIWQRGRGGGVNCWPHALCVNNPTHCQFAGQPQGQGSASWTLQGGLTQSVVNIFPFVFGWFVFEDNWTASNDDDKEGGGQSELRVILGWKDSSAAIHLPRLNWDQLGASSTSATLSISSNRTDFSALKFKLTQILANLKDAFKNYLADFFR